MTDLAEENRKLRTRLRRLTETARHNEAVFRRSLAREEALLAADDLPALIEALSVGLKDAFAVDGLTLTLADSRRELRGFLLFHGIDPGALPGVRFLEAQAVARELGEPIRTRLGAWHPHRHAHIFPASARIASLATLPLARHGSLLGYLSLGSRDPRRFDFHLAVDFLDRLGQIAALCMENAVQRERLRLHSLTDVLTGLPNRRHLEERLQQEVARAMREERPLSGLFVDADHFKAINDRYGHPAGDQALRLLAECIRSELRTSDLAARYGGEEFTLILPGTTIADARAIGERIRRRVADAELALADGQLLRLTISLGASTLEPPFSGDDPAVMGSRLLRQADQALYRAKARGRNRVVAYPELAGEVVAAGISH